MMKSVTTFFVASAILLAPAASDNTLVFCGNQPCQIALTISCDDFIEQYDLQGSCCSLEKIPAYDGCRINVSGGGQLGANCYWTPKCADCNGENFCGKNYESFSPVACPKSPDGYPTSWTFDTKASCAPTVAPTSKPPTLGSSSPVTLSLFTVLSTIIIVSIAIVQM